MLTFSERYGFASARSTFQIASIDTRLRTAMWNCIVKTIFERMSYQISGDYYTGIVARKIQADFLYLPIDDLEKSSDQFRKKVKFFSSSALGTSVMTL